MLKQLKDIDIAEKVSLNLKLKNFQQIQWQDYNTLHKHNEPKSST